MRRIDNWNWSVIKRGLDRKGLLFYWIVFMIGLCYVSVFGGLLIQNL